MLIKPGSKVVMIGDSITDCGRAQPVGEGLGASLGNGYVSFVEGLLNASVPCPKLRVVNMGCGGHTVRDLKARWKRDVLDLKPDWLSIKIGINDVWRQFDLPLQTENHVRLPEYAETLEGLVKTSLKQLKLQGLVLMTPYLIEPNRQEPMRRMMDQYGEVVKRLAKKYKALLVDTQEAFDEVLGDIHPMTLAWDRVHPNTLGHLIIARAFLKVIEYRW